MVVSSSFESFSLVLTFKMEGLNQISTLPLIMVIFVIPGIVAPGFRRCTHSSQCIKALDKEFCDSVLETCMPCDRECTGSKSLERNCMNKCKKKYIEVYLKQTQTQKPNVTETIPVVGKDKGLSNGKVPNSFENNRNKDVSSSTISGGVLLVVCAVPVLAIGAGVAVLAVWYRKIRPKKKYHRGHVEDPSPTDPEESGTDTDVDAAEPPREPPETTPAPTLEMLNQADFVSSSKDQCLPSGSSCGFDMMIHNRSPT